MAKKPKEETLIPDELDTEAAPVEGEITCPNCKHAPQNSVRLAA
jgi:hypothetical protein